MATSLPQHIKGIQSLLKQRGLPDTKHPLIGVIDITALKELPKNMDLQVTTDFYFIGMSNSTQACLEMKYGQDNYDFDKGVMNFIAPGRIFRFNDEEADALGHSGWLLLLHPDFLWNNPLAQRIKRYAFFDYSVNEALFLAESEQQALSDLFRNIEKEYSAIVDDFSQEIIIAQIQSLLAYSERFYQRQFITRKIVHHKVVSQVDVLLEKAFSQKVLEQNGIPTVLEISSQLHISPNYLSGLLKTLTGNSTQQHIQAKIIEKAKERLMMTDLTVSEIAYELGFEYPQSFSKLFKTKTNISPLEFRKSGRL